MKRVLLTGASGFIGRQCIPMLLAKGYEVHAVARTIPATYVTTSSTANVHWHQTDLLTGGNATKLIQNVAPDSLLHLAWYAVPGKFWEAPENQEWVQASVELFEAFVATAGKRVVAAGTCAEYASDVGECIEESTPLSPRTFYGQCKHSLQQTLDALSNHSKVSAAWGRIFHLYGPGEDCARVVPYVIRSLLRGEPALCSDGLQILDFLHVQDVAAALVALLESTAQGPINIASGESVELRVVLSEIARQIARPKLLRLGVRPSVSPPDRWWGNVAKLTGELRWRPGFALETGLANTIRWWRNAD